MGSPMDKKRFQRFYEENFDKVYRFVLFRVKGDREKAEDLVSEIFMKALEHFDNYDESRGKSAWLMMIARNHVISSWRDERITTVSLTIEDKEGGEVEEDFYLINKAKEALKTGEVEYQIRELIANLSEEDADIVTFHYLFGYSYKEIAEMQNMTEGAVKVAAHRAIKKLREHL